MKKMKDISNIYRKAVRWFSRKTFALWQIIGFHVTPNHYYQPIPDTRTLKNELWLKQSELVGIDINENGQLGLLSLIASQFKGEYEQLSHSKLTLSYQYSMANSSFGSVDAEILYSMIRFFKPNNIFEIGSGNSTLLSAQAVLKNNAEGAECKLLAYEPYPNSTLRDGFPGLYKLYVKKVQDIPLSDFDNLKENDILFIDSSHVLKIGSDVHYEYLDILPRLRKGVIVHIHDIFLPLEYPKEWILKKYMFWNEQYLLQAFLSFNTAFEILWAGSYMHLKHPDKLSTAFSSYNRNETWPGSFWIRRIK